MRERLGSLAKSLNTLFGALLLVVSIVPILAAKPLVEREYRAFEQKHLDKEVSVRCVNSRLLAGRAPASSDAQSASFYLDGKRIGKDTQAPFQQSVQISDNRVHSFEYRLERTQGEPTSRTFKFRFCGEDS